VWEHVVFSDSDGSVFRLDKWYLDCVTDGGSVVVAYWATVRLGVVPLRYAACLAGRAADGLTARYTLWPGAAPAADRGVVRWGCRRLRISGTWDLREPAIERTLLAERAGRIEWRCIGPRAEVVVRVGAETLRGTGYVEHLTVSLPPWRLPFSRLRWGRFHGAHDTVIWIAWWGGLERRWVFANGIDRSGTDIQPRAVVLENGDRLELDDGVELRTGALRHTALRPMRVIAGLVPRWRSAHETKWLAPARLLTSTGVAHGWALHEEVTWA